MRHNPWIQTYSGKAFQLLNPTPEAFDIVDIAHALSMQCRFNGHVRRFYSVAEHCYYVSHIVPTPAALAGLLHDAAEAYVSDIPSPLKRVLPDFVEYEDRIMAVVSQRFGLDALPPGVDASVHAADKWIVYQEAKALFLNPELVIKWPTMAPYTPRLVIDYATAGWSPEEAKTRFLERFAELTTPDGAE